MHDIHSIGKLLTDITGTDFEKDLHCIPHAIIVEPSALSIVCNTLFTHKELYFDSLSCITAIDNGHEKMTMEVLYTLYSIPYHHGLTIKVIVPREKPVVPTVCDIWKTADWHEREAFDMTGIVFAGHPDLRRILLPADWEGYPLRKDYHHQAYYRGVKVEWTNQQ